MSDVRPTPSVFATGVVVVAMPTARAIVAGGNQPPRIFARLTARNMPVKPQNMFDRYCASKEKAKMRATVATSTIPAAMSTMLRVPILSERMPAAKAKKMPMNCEAE